MRESVLILFLGTCLASVAGQRFFQSPSSHVGMSFGSYTPFHHQHFGQRFRFPRSSPSYPVWTPRNLPHGLFSRQFQPQTFFQPRPSIRWYNQRPSARVRQIPPMSGIPFHTPLPQRFGSPQRFTGSRRLIQRTPTFHARRQTFHQRRPSVHERRTVQEIASRRIVPSRIFRQRQAVARSGSQPSHGQVLAIFAVDDARHQRSRPRVGQSSFARFSRPHLSATVDKGVKRTPIVKQQTSRKAISDKSNTIDINGIEIAGKKTNVEERTATVDVAVPIVSKAETVVDVRSVSTNNDNNNANTDTMNANTDTRNANTDTRNAELNNAEIDADVGSFAVESVVKSIGEEAAKPAVFSKEIFVKENVNTDVVETGTGIAVLDAIIVEQNPVLTETGTGIDVVEATVVEQKPDIPDSGVGIAVLEPISVKTNREVSDIAVVKSNGQQDISETDMGIAVKDTTVVEQQPYISDTGMDIAVIDTTAVEQNADISEKGADIAIVATTVVEPKQDVAEIAMVKSKAVEQTPEISEAGMEIAIKEATEQIPGIVENVPQ